MNTPTTEAEMNCQNYCFNKSTHTMKLGNQVVRVCGAHYYVFKYLGFEVVDSTTFMPTI